MKKFTKLFLSCMAVSAITAAIATSAMAADVTGDVTGTYDEATGVLRITAPADMKTDTQSTVLVLPSTVDDTDTDAITANAEYVDQAANAQFGKDGAMGLKTSPTAPETGASTYNVKFGYYNNDDTFKVVTGKFTLGEAVGEDIILGEVDGMAAMITTNDATCVLKYATKQKTGTGNVGKLIKLTDGSTLMMGEVDGMEAMITTNDATCILRYATKQKTGIGNVGEKVTGVVVEE